MKRRIEALGGQYNGHLTRKVTHLVAGKIIRSDKYKVKCNGHIICTDLLSRVQRKSLRSQSCSLHSLKTVSRALASVLSTSLTYHMISPICFTNCLQMIKLHSVPPLFGCKISISGLSGIERKEVSDIVSRLGGIYSAELSRNCTHLLAKQDSISLGSTGPKLQFASKWGIPVADMGWLHECSAKDMYVDERAGYLVEVTASQQAPHVTSGAYDDVTLADVQAARNIPQYLAGCRIYLGSGSSLSDDRLTLLKKLILSAGGTRYSEASAGDDVTHFIVHSQVLTGKEAGMLQKFKHQPIVVHDQWLLACFVAKARLEPDLYRVDAALIRSHEKDSAQIPDSQTTLGSRNIWSTKRASQMGGAGPDPNWVVPHRKIEASQPHSHSQPVQSQGVFSRIKLFLHSQLMAQYAERVIRHGAALVESEQLSDYAVWPAIVIDPLQATHSVTEPWLKRCLSERKISPCEPYSPIHAKKPVDRSSFISINICSTGFREPEREFMFHLVTSGLGAACTDSFSKNNTHLICKAGVIPSGPKVDFARKIRIPCVTEQWLIDCATEGTLLPWSSYAVETEDLEKEEKTQPPAKRGCVMSSRGPSLPLSLPISSSLPAVPVDTPVRRDLNARLRQATNNILPAPAQSDAIGPTQAIAKEQIGTLLHGLVFSISQRLWHRREELYELVTSLGGTFLWAYDAACTHYLHQGNRVDETFREFRLAKHCGKLIISPHWLMACKDSGERVPEAEYPHHHNPDKLAEASESGTAPLIDDVPMSKINSHSNPLPIKIEPIQVQFEEPVHVPDTFLATLDVPLKTARTHVVTYASINVKEQTEPIEQIAEGDVGAIISRPSSTEGLSQGARRLTIADDPSKPASQTQRRFIISGISGPEKNTLASIIADLGGTLLDQNEWDLTATHLIVRQPSKSEKYLGACAAGLWILRPEYLEACKVAAKMLPEAEWEVQPVWNDTPADGAIKSAPRAWRMHLSATGKKGAFEGWTALLAIDNKRLPGFIRILKSGGANIVTLTDNDALTATQLNLTHIIFTSHAMRCKIPAEIQERHPPSIFKPIEFVAEHLLSPPRL